MSTRSLIHFIDSEGNKVSTYRHYDGYPEAVLPELEAFLKWNGGRNDDLSYTIANYFYYMKKTRVEKSKKDDFYKKANKADRERMLRNYNELTGFGLCIGGITDCGQEFEYEVHLPTATIKVVAPI